MKVRRFSMNCLFLLVLFCLPLAVEIGADEGKSDKKVDMSIDINKEDRDVGLKRMELLDKTLSRDLMERKRTLVRNLEQDYNQKIKDLIDSIIPPVFKNKIFTHLDVNFFAPEFDREIQASQNIAVSIILKHDGFESWAKQNSSKEEALKILKQVIAGTFKIPFANLAILVID